tara:strand:+ start:152 stop:301 length:150 start_codon:yes stop_codon:yes gene_type:complete
MNLHIYFAFWFFIIFGCLFLAIRSAVIQKSIRFEQEEEKEYREYDETGL